MDRIYAALIYTHPLVIIIHTLMSSRKALIFHLLKELKTHQEASHKELFCGKCGTASPSLELVRIKTTKLERIITIIVLA